MNKRHQEQPAAGVNLALIITPMLDMSFQILAFFIMTYHPSALEGHIPGSLVPPEQSATHNKDQNKVAEDIPPSVPEADILPELAEAVTVKVKAAVPGQGDRLDGQPGQLLIKRTLDPAAQVVADVDSSYEQSLKRLDAELRAIKKSGGAEMKDLKLEADGTLKQQYVMQVYDLCKRSGFTKVHFVPPALTK